MLDLQDMDVGECVGATGGATCSTVTASATRGSTAGTLTQDAHLTAGGGDTLPAIKEGDHQSTWFISRCMV